MQHSRATSTPTTPDSDIIMTRGAGTYTVTDTESDLQVYSIGTKIAQEVIKSRVYNWTAEESV